MTCSVNCIFVIFDLCFIEYLEHRKLSYDFIPECFKWLFHRL
ncbi:hypothetical protein DESC_740021 [Desulfosarcina cetonica]|nr:hypothetical protein DESC_740021 [Desulfosarcina cetonica]